MGDTLRLLAPEQATKNVHPIRVLGIALETPPTVPKQHRKKRDFSFRD
jgi:hypothetical protein